ncbi:MAG: hypothetical protein PW789_09820 [Edaphobacter sp.]|uniref:hypothetical protein n=1 Tax=Edaphobacter sp. TaxID=1934404 RepID=UPI00238AF0F4|nr:hypothetical protein [Edaphobacter sp.]MDE1176890.1 hypothetical protein [Edaphobacter sp.]
MKSTRVLFKTAALTLLLPSALLAQSVALNPATMAKLGTVDPRYQGYNIEMVEVTGGRFWAPYKQQGEPQADDASKASVPAGMDPSLYRYRAPINLSNPKLRKLAAALGPSYVRVSGTWANSTYFHDSDTPAPKTPPTGFNSVLTRSEWKGVLDFTKAVNGSLVTSFAVSPGVRDANGIWTPVEASKILAYTKSAGGSIAAAEMFNEPSFAAMGGAPKGYTAQTYGKDFQAFHAYISKAAPKMIVLGPGSVGEAGGLVPEAMKQSMLKSTDMLEASGPGINAFSYHFYGGGSQRCLSAGMPPMVSPETALSDEWLSKTNHDEAFYAELRDKYAPGKPMWLTETGETACGGDPWASTFIDSFRYLNQLGSLAKRGVQAIQHNTLAASDYALLDEDTYTPRPNYWAALLWRRMMGTTVLDADPKAAPSGTPSTPGLYLYAHCLRDQPGDVALLAINAGKEQHTITLPQAAERYTLTSDNLTSSQVALNGVDLALTGKDDLPTLSPTPTPAGEITLAPDDHHLLLHPQSQ